MIHIDHVCETTTSVLGKAGGLYSPGCREELFSPTALTTSPILGTELPVYGLLGNLTLSCVAEPHTIRIMLHRTETGWASATLMLRRELAAHAAIPGGYPRPGRS